MQQQPDVGATFTTTRTRPMIAAVISTLLFLVLTPRDFSYDRETLAIELFVDLVCLLCLLLAIRSWRRVLRRPVELRLTPTGLNVKRGDSDLAVPWNAVSQIRIDGDVRQPWVVAWLELRAAIMGYGRRYLDANV
jgi:hypothetical protein